MATLIDRESPGTFVGDASAGEILRAAADATRDDPAPRGWTWSTTVRTERNPLRGRRCRTCPVERAVLERRYVSELWSGPGGETYESVGTVTPRAWP